MLSGAYKIPAIQINITACFTNKMATDAYRGAGRPEATYVVERAMDLVAADLKMDPAELRRKNFPAASEFPFHTATGLDYDSGDYEAALNKAQGIADYAKLRTDQRAARAAWTATSGLEFPHTLRFAHLVRHRQCPPAAGKAPLYASNQRVKSPSLPALLHTVKARRRRLRKSLLMN